MQAAPSPFDILLAQERALRYPEGFNSAKAFALGCAVADLASEYDREIGVRIYRESDGLVLFQWMMDSKAERNVTYMDGKRIAAHACGHASLWAWVDHELTGARDELFEKDSPACPTSGAFPLIDGRNGSWTATLAVSGLHEGGDHELGIRALCHALGKEYGKDVPIYQGPLH